MTPLRRLAVVLLVPLLACLGTAAAGQTVYRCGPEGRSYSDQPCPGGREVEVADPRTEAQRREGEQAARRETASAEQLRRERLAREREAAAAPPSRATRQKMAARPPARESDHRTARVPKASPHKQKAGDSRP